LRPGVDGVIFTAGGRRATFLPQVWEQLPEPTEFLARLRQKAGLPASYWGPDVRLARYAVRKWKEDPC
jgi:AMMECR1 domain-containing protein